MQKIKIKAPAKINLTLEVLDKRHDGYHNIQSVMQTISLYDYLTIILTEKSGVKEIILSGTSDEIPYDEANLVYKSAKLFMDYIGGKNYRLDIHIEKNIPIAAGLGGGSTDAAATMYGLNKLFNDKLEDSKLHLLCAKIGSDLNVCLMGGCLLATKRGEEIKPLPVLNETVTLIKPRKLGISARYAYNEYSRNIVKTEKINTELMIKAIEENRNITPFLYNDLEVAVIDKFKELQEIKSRFPNSLMSGSGSTYFILGNGEIDDFDTENYQILSGLKFIKTGVSISDTFL